MNPIAIIKAGGTFEEYAKEHGDFEDWSIAGLGVPRDQCIVVELDRDPLPALDSIRGILITGSHAMLTDTEDTHAETCEWLRKATEKNTLTLGICYGHQLLGHALGGRVTYLEGGKEAGTVPLTLTPEAKDDPLFSILPSPFTAQVTHSQCVSVLPPDAQCLAFSDRDPHQAFAVGQSAWGVQFHPEFNADVVRMYVDRNRELLISQDQDPDAIFAAVKDSPYNDILMRRFAELTQSSGR